MANNGKLEEVRGVVEAVSYKFNGAVLVNGTWYNFAKGLKNTAVKGGEVVLTLEPWESKGKTGKNIIALDARVPNGEVKQDTSKGVDLRTSSIKGNPFGEALKPATNGMTKEEWQGKDRSQLVGGRSHDAAELVSASLTTMTPMTKVLELYKEALTGILEVAKEIK